MTKEQKLRSMIFGRLMYLIRSLENFRDDVDCLSDDFLNHIDTACVELSLAKEILKCGVLSDNADTPTS